MYKYTNFFLRRIPFYGYISHFYVSFTIDYSDVSNYLVTSTFFLII